MAVCRDREVRLLRDEVLGIGSYGLVCKAVCEQLPCAAKIIHSTFFPSKNELMDPGMPRMLERFSKECELLSTIRHPCVVQYICHYVDQETKLPVLLMELMDESLTKFLEKLQEPVPYHIQLNITHDIVLALAFLHSKGIIHRDLSSNNVLLIGGSRAKVTDFGMSKLVDINQHMTPLTQCPGTQVYMAPESLRSTPMYTEKLDIFAAGVLVIQIITRRFPDPGVPKITLEDERYGLIEAAIAESERRKKDIDMVGLEHPLRPIVLNCLADRESQRPSAVGVCRDIVALKATPKYEQSVRATQERLASIKTLEEQTKLQTRELELQRREIEQLHAAHQEEIERLNATISTKDGEVQDLRGEVQDLREQVSEKDKLIEKLQQDEAKAAENLSKVHEEKMRAELKKKDVEIERQKELACRYQQKLENAKASRQPAATGRRNEQPVEPEKDSLSPENWLITDDPARDLDFTAPSSDLWYHGRIDRTLACKRLEEPKTPGAYLIRESKTEKDAFVLSYLDRECRVHHFRIDQRNKRYNIGGSNSFSTLHNLVGFHTRYSSVMEKFSERLEVPIPPPATVSLPPNIH